MSGKPRMPWHAAAFFADVRRQLPRRAGLLLGTVLVLAACGPPARACSVPVFRYALERWPASTYEAVVFHRGPLTSAQAALLARLSGGGGSNEPPANLTARTVDLEAQPPAGLRALWARHRTNPLPALVLRFPAGAPVETEVWSGPLTAENVRRLFESPTRHRLVKHLLDGDSAVWLLLESGDPARDNAAAGELAARLAHLEKTLRLAKLETEDITNRVISVPETALKVAFPLVRLSRADPAEEIFIRMLLGVEEDLDGIREPMAVPVFGRGRALFALVGEGINAETIAEACEFLIGPCSCIVKEENPGLDLLLAVDWDAQVRLQATADLDEPPPLTGVSTVLAATNAPAPAPVETRPRRASPSGAEPALGRRIVIALGLTTLVLLGGSVLVLRRRR